MIEYKNAELRNLQEQVLKNKEDIAKHYEIDRSLANLGIKIVGQISSAAELPDPATYTGAFGDAYAVGVKADVDAGTATYDYYIYTRPDLNTGATENYWLNVGKISIAGPQGIQGPIGPQGPQGESSTWYAISSSQGPQPGNYRNGDMAIVIGAPNNPSIIGNIYRYSTTAAQWNYLMNIRGPQGVQGIQGERGPQGPTGPRGAQGPRGDTGGLVNIAGILSAENQLPTPASLNNVTIAYLVGTNKDLYIQVGTTPATAVWTNIGPINVATLVTTNGTYQNTWETNTKVDKATSSSVAPRVYGIDKAGNQTIYPIAADTDGTGFLPISQSLPVYYNPNQPFSSADIGINLITGTPTQDIHCATKKYVDDKVASAGGGGGGGGSAFHKVTATVVGTPTNADRAMYTIDLFIPDDPSSYGITSFTNFCHFLSGNYGGATGIVRVSNDTTGLFIVPNANGYSGQFSLLTATGIKIAVIDNDNQVESFSLSAL